MIKTKKIEIEVNRYNLRCFKKFGYKIGEITSIDISSLSSGSHQEIECSCDVCGFERVIPYRQYMDSYKKYNLYCCSSKCSQFKNKKTKINKYNDVNFNNRELYKKTCIEKYGVDNIFKDKITILKIDKVKRDKYGDNLEDIVNKMSNTIFRRYGVDNISKLEYIKLLKQETSFKKYGVYHSLQSDIIKNISRNTCMSKYGTIYPTQSDIVKNKIMETNNKRYGVNWYILSENYRISIKNRFGESFNSPIDILNNWKNSDNYLINKPYIYEKIKNTNIINGNWYNNSGSNEYIHFRRKVVQESLKNKNTLISNWDGMDYYDNEFIGNNFELNSSDRYYPTIDHKISIKYGYINNVDIYFLSSINNLCITKRYINSSKNSLNECDFVIK